MSDDQKWSVRPWYYSQVTADPVNPDVVYVMNLSTWRSIDGGKNWTRLRVPHGDTHQTWVDPKDPNRLINANDGGATVSLDYGKTWSSIYNQPTSQFYHVMTDSQWPYRIYGAQQDNSTVSIASRSDFGSIGERDWWPVAGCENAHIAIDPKCSNTPVIIPYLIDLSWHFRLLDAVTSQKATSGFTRDKFLCHQKQSGEDKNGSSDEI